MVAAKLFAEIEEAVVQLMLASAGDCLSNGGAMSTGTSAKIETFHTLLSRLVSERDEARKERDRAVEALVETLRHDYSLTYGDLWVNRNGPQFVIYPQGDAARVFTSADSAVAALLKEAS